MTCEGSQAHADQGTVDPIRVLAAYEEPQAATRVLEMLRTAWGRGLVVTLAPGLSEAARELSDHGATCVLLSLAGSADGGANLPEAVGQLRAAAPGVPIIAVREQDDEEAGAEAIRAGAQDCLIESELHPALLARSIRYAVERTRSEVELAQRALHDPLSRLPNRALFLDRLTVALERSRRTGSSLAVLFLDVDGFKRINDGLGHAAGDALLVELAGRFGQLLRPMDTVARFGGDEFTFLFEELSSEREAMRIAGRISASAALPVTTDSGQMSVTASIGIAFVTDPSLSPEEILREADAAMYRAKEKGGARSEMFDETSRTRAARRLALEDALQRAVAASQLRVHFQPWVSLAAETELTGFEALVRWEHPERGLLEPDAFLAVAEETGLILPIGDWVLQRALAQLGRWRQSRPDISIAVNLSARQLAGAELPVRVLELVRASGADPGGLWLDVPEAALAADPDLTSGVLTRLREAGVRLAIDDFGTGRSSLAALRGLPVDALKLHTSFVAELGGPAADRAEPVVGAMVELGHALGLHVVAEGVESELQLARVRELGCDGAQGHLFSRPLPEEEVPALLAAP